MNEAIQESFCLTYKMHQIKSKKRTKKDNVANFYQITLEEWGKINSDDNLDIISKYQKNKDKTLLDTIIKENYKLIHHTIKRYNLAANEAIEYADLEQEGYIGLIKAINNFDSTKNVLFSTFAVNYIRGYIVQYVKLNSNSIGISLHGTNLISKLKKDEKSIKDDKLKTSLKTISVTPLFLDAPVNNSSDESRNAEELIGGENSVDFDNIDFKMTWQKIALKLNEKEKKIVEYYIQGDKWVDISKKLNLSPQTVRVAGITAFRKIKERYGEDELRELLCV